MQKLSICVNVLDGCKEQMLWLIGIYVGNYLCYEFYSLPTLAGGEASQQLPPRGSNFKLTL